MSSKLSTEDQIINTMIDNEYLLFPEEAANIDQVSLEAIEKSYNYDMAKNSDILGDISLKEYLNTVNPQLLFQRSISKKSLVTKGLLFLIASPATEGESVTTISPLK